MRVYSFPQGGIQFRDPAVPQKTASAVAFLPGLSVIPLVQHSGARAAPVVAIGDYVREGMLIGRGQGPGSANIHATVPGKVIKTVSWQMSDGRTNEGLVIRLEGSFEILGKREEFSPWENLRPREIQRLLAEYGIVEMEGPGNPLGDMFVREDSTGESISLVVRCVFDDPWLAADYVLCRERFRVVCEGAVITARAAGAERIIVAVSYRERDLGRRLLEDIETYGIPVSLVMVGDRYPQRNRRELELALRSYGKKEGLAIAALLILGPATLAAVHDAVKLKRPILDRYVAVGGQAVRTPQVLKVRIGTRIGDLFEECGGFVEKPRRIATGSPIRGREVLDLDEPVIKTCSAVFALLDGPGGGETTRACISCGECRIVCPVGLDPEYLYKRTAETASGGGGRAAECHGCGCCDLVCPSRLPLSSVIVNSEQGGRHD
ncbi:MAG: SLBB domain-containing protein [Treponema sp.]|jgi:electron transport complex protein RnfC|nr:SLBB domain-containing protein [Treponema sp.]